jgi:hypothetical protein
MKMPGFTAGAALYETSERYQTAAALGQGDAELIRPADYGQCVYSCLGRCRPRGSSQCADYCAQSCIALLQG